MTDNGFGGKANSRDFNIRVYSLQPDFKTADGGSRRRSPSATTSSSATRDGVIGFPIVNEGTAERILTGGDIDPESIQRGRDGTSGWATSSARGSCTSTPRAGCSMRRTALPDGLWSPNHPRLAELGPTTIANSRGIEAMALTPDGRYLYVVLEGAVLGDAAESRRVYEFDTRHQRFTGRLRRLPRRAGAAGDTNLVADAQAPDRHRLLLIERDGGRGSPRRTARCTRSTCATPRPTAPSPSGWSSTWRRSPTPTSCRCRRSTPATSGSATRSG